MTSFAVIDPSDPTFCHPKTGKVVCFASIGEASATTKTRPGSGIRDCEDEPNATFTDQMRFIEPLTPKEQKAEAKAEEKAEAAAEKKADAAEAKAEAAEEKADAKAEREAKAAAAKKQAEQAEAKRVADAKARQQDQHKRH